MWQMIHLYFPKHEWEYWTKNIEQSLLFFDGLNK